MLGLGIPKTLHKKRFFSLDGSHEVGQPSGGKLQVAGMLSRPAMQFCRSQHHLPLQAAAKECVVLGTATDPAALHVGIGNPSVVGS